MAWNLCTSGAAIAKAGANANATIVASGAILALWSDESEASIIAETLRDWITNPPSANTAGALADVVSSHIGNKIIAYDPSAYPSQVGTMLNVNADIIRKGIAFLSKQEYKDKM